MGQLSLDPWEENLKEWETGLGSEFDSIIFGNRSKHDRRVDKIKDKYVQAEKLKITDKGLVLTF